MESNKTQEESVAKKSPVSSDDLVQKALIFARDIARDEIRSIDRLHKRTLFALGIQVAAFGLLFSFLGWIGYSNLKRVAVQQTTLVVKERLADELTKKNIDDSVKDVLREHATDQITHAINDHVASAIAEQLANQAPGLRARTEAMTARAIANLQPQIEAFAKQQALELIHKANEPRHLVSEQRAILTGCLSKTSHSALTVAVGGDPEAQHFEEEISTTLEAGGWKVERLALLGTHLDFPSYGLVIATAPELKQSPAVRDLTNCLQAARLHAQMQTNPKSAEWGNQIVLIVLPKAR